MAEIEFEAPAGRRPDADDPKYYYVTDGEVDNTIEATVLLDFDSDGILIGIEILEVIP